MKFQPRECGLDDFFGVAAELDHEGRQEGERMAAQRAKKSADRQLENLGPADQMTHVAAVPPEAAGLVAQVALRGLGELLPFKVLAVLADLICEQQQKSYQNFWNSRRLGTSTPLNLESKVNTHVQVYGNVNNTPHKGRRHIILGTLKSANWGLPNS